MTWLRDVILIMVAVGLLVAVLWPEPQTESTESDVPESKDAISPASSPSAINFAVKTPVLKPMMNIPHRLFPLVEGGHWKYLVTGSEELFSENAWSLFVERLPQGDTPGEIQMGFGENWVAYKIWQENEGVIIEGLPFSAPLRFLGNKATATSGNWLPPIKYIIEDAVWEYRMTRDIQYRSRGKNKKIFEESATGTQTDRATVKSFEKVIVPAGVFTAYQIQWNSRMDIFTKKNKRKVLENLTAKPFKHEKTWFAPGIGMVKRRVTYNTKNKEDITFDLVSFTRPSKKKPKQLLTPH